MTKDQVYKRIAEVLQARPRSDLAVLRDELNHELKEKGWVISPFTTYGNGIGCDVNEIPIAPAPPTDHSLFTNASANCWNPGRRRYL